MKPAARRRIVASVCLVASVWLLPGAAPASPLGPMKDGVVSHIVTLRAVGGFSLSRSFSEALSYFRTRGAIAARTGFDQAGCTVHIQKLGIRFWYLQDDPLRNATAGTCNHFKAAVVTGAGWHTRNGLSVGDSTARMRALFPNAYNTRRRGGNWTSPPGSVQWDITITSGAGGERPALSASVIRGRVVALLVEMVGH